MERRDFLKYFGAALTVTLLPARSLHKIASLPIETESRGRRFRGSAEGDIYFSQDAGQTWQLHTRLGSEYRVMDLVTDTSDQVYALIGFLDRQFHLALSRNGKSWNTL